MLLILSVMSTCGGCGGSNPDGEGFPVALPIERVILTASIDFNPVERENAFYETDFTGTLQVPTTLDVVEGNSGTGFAALTVGNTKYCYRGNAVNESTANGTQYFFVYQKSDLVSLCSVIDGGEDVFDGTADVAIGDELSLMIESPGCSLEADACDFTEVSAVLNVVN